jgi:hypothetical protein
VRDGKAVMQVVRVARQVGDRVVIDQGVAAGDQVIVNVPFALTSGSPVIVQSAATVGEQEKDKKEDASGRSKSSKSKSNAS